MRYIADNRSLTGFGRFSWEVLAPDQAGAWLDRGPVETLIRREEIAALVGALTGVPVFSSHGTRHGTGRSGLFQDMEMYPPDQALLCYLDAGEETSALRSASLEEKRRLLRFGLLTCQEHSPYQVDPAAPLPAYPSLPTDTETVPYRYVYSSPTLASAGTFDFQVLAQAQAIEWLARGPVISRLRLHQMAQAFQYIVGKYVEPNYQDLPQLRPGDQALVFFVGPRSRGFALTSMHPQEICEQYDLGLLTCLSVVQDSQAPSPTYAATAE
jgi:hypothetical protein